MSTFNLSLLRGGRLLALNLAPGRSRGAAVAATTTVRTASTAVDGGSFARRHPASAAGDHMLQSTAVATSEDNGRRGTSEESPADAIVRLLLVLLQDRRVLHGRLRQRDHHPVDRGDHGGVCGQRVGKTAEVRVEVVMLLVVQVVVVVLMLLEVLL